MPKAISKQVSYRSCRWELIAGRIPGRKPAEIQGFWMTTQENGDQEISRREMPMIK
jgi:hypothetical protein